MGAAHRSGHYLTDLSPNTAPQTNEKRLSGNQCVKSLLLSCSSEATERVARMSRSQDGRRDALCVEVHRRLLSQQLVLD
jgi:hypothetical protein